MSWDIVINFFCIIVNNVEYFANLCVIAITLYVFYLRFISKRISIISGYVNSGRNGTIHSYMIKNHSLREMYISEIYIVYDNRYALHIGSWKDEPLVLKAQGVCRVKTKPFSYLDVYERVNMWDVEKHLFIRTIEGDVIFATFDKKTKIDKKALIKKIPIMRAYFNNELLEPMCKYALSYRKKGEEPKVLYIFPSGVMSDMLYEYDEKNKNYKWFNGIPQSVVDDPSQLLEFFKMIFKPFDMEYINLNIINLGDLYKSRKSIDDLTEVSYGKMWSPDFPKKPQDEQMGFRTEITS